MATEDLFQQTLRNFLQSQGQIIVKFVEDFSNTDDPSVPLYCFHEITGSITSYFDLVQQLGTKQCSYGIQAPPEIRETKIVNITGLAQHYANELNHFQPYGPLALAGWSAGAVLALETARELKQDGRQVFLIVIDGELCNTGAELKPQTWQYRRQLAYNFPLALTSDIIVSGYNLLKHCRSFKSANKYIQKEIEIAWYKIKRTRKDLHRHAAETFLSRDKFTVDHWNFITKLCDAMLKFHHEKYDGPVVVYAAKVGPLTRIKQVKEPWRAISNAEIVPVWATHLNIIYSPRVKEIAQDLRHRLDEWNKNLNKVEINST
jgi:thioesterase domain-containing protein